MYCDIEVSFTGVKDRYDEAIRYYDKAIALHPEFAQSYRERGLAYSNKGDFERAVEDLTKAIELNPDFTVSYVDRGFNRIRTGDYDGAISDYNWAIKHDALNKASAYCNLGDAYRRKGDFDTALKKCNKAISLNPIFYYPYKIRGCIYYDRKDYEKAIEDFTQVVDGSNDGIEVEAAAVYDLRGKCYRAIGEEDLASADDTNAEELRNAKTERERYYQRLWGF
jgi:tetratricopeptide (TPR) repeat protein